MYDKMIELIENYDINAEKMLEIFINYYGTSIINDKDFQHFLDNEFENELNN